jgi:hypothetical protein
VIVRIALVLLLAVMLPAAGSAACVVDQKATVPLRTVAGSITVAIEIDGTAATFILDTGAWRTMVTDQAVQRLGLARDQWVSTTLRGIGGIVQRPNANPRSISIGGIPLVRQTLTHDHSLTVGVLSGARAQDAGIDGLLGRDFLAPFDLDLDLPANRLTLYQVSDCAGRFLPWSGKYTAIPVSIPQGNAIILPVTIDGTQLHAVLDTGAASSVLAAPGMFKLGLDQSKLAADPSALMSGVGPRVVTVHHHQFNALTVGDQTIASPALWAEPIRITPIADMLLGADWLAQRRIWISFATKQLFLAD